MARPEIAFADIVDMKPRRHFPSMLNLRMHSVERFRGVPDYYLFIDDDLEFLEGAGAYMLKVFGELVNRRPEVYQLFGSRYPNELMVNPEEVIMTTNRGLFIRSDKLLSLINTYHKYLGGGEDALLGYYALEGKHANRLVRGGAPISRKDVKHFELNAESTIHDEILFDTEIGKYIRARYNDPDWDILSGKLPKGLK